MTWSAHTTPDGKSYFYNALTNQTTWEKPDELKTPLELALDKLPWKKVVSADGKVYYYNKQTNTTTWTCPKEYQDVLDSFKTPAVTSNPAISSPAITSTATVQSVKPPGATTFPNLTLKNSVVAISTFSSTSRATHPLPIRRPSSPPLPEYKTKQEAETAFKKLLDESGVKTDWTWDQTMRVIISNPKYQALKTLAERKATFYNYVEEKKQREREEHRVKLERSRKEFLELLKNSKVVTSSTRFRKVVELFGHHECFKFLSEKERERIFDDHIEELSRREKEVLRISRKENLEKFRKMAYSFPNISIYTTWKEFQKMYESSMDYIIDQKLQKMDKIDFLSVFEELMKGLEGEYLDKQKVIIDRRNREARIARAGFKELLKELDIKAETKWKDVYPKFKDDERYKNMIGQPGSSPLELFWDVVVEMDRKLIKAREIGLRVVRDHDINELDLEKFMHLLGSDFVNTIGTDTITTVFNELKEGKLVRQPTPPPQPFPNGSPNQPYYQNQQRYDRQYNQHPRRSYQEPYHRHRSTEPLVDPNAPGQYQSQTLASHALSNKAELYEIYKSDRKIQKKVSSFKHYLKKLDSPAITLDSKWEDVQKRVEGREEYIAVKEFAEIGFDLYLERLKEKSMQGSSDDESRKRRKEKKKEKDHKKKHRRGDDDSEDEERRERSRKKKSKRDERDENGDEKKERKEEDDSAEEGEVRY
ncbi:hypothetical protein HK098_003190 [Nowakowskiella sp. JEL0407]|nr:hypothetical protein HK098_003190 [Nowakowskiella sp. JEL0407]